MKVVRFEVIHPVHGNLLGYVYALDIDNAYDLAALRYKGMDIVIVTTSQQRMEAVA